jgi:hypothetical protein
MVTARSSATSSEEVCLAVRNPMRATLSGTWKRWQRPPRRSLPGRGAWKRARRGAGRGFHGWKSRAGGAGHDFHGWNRRRRTPEPLLAGGQRGRVSRAPSFHGKERPRGGPPARVPVEGARSRRGSARLPGRTGRRRPAAKPLREAAAAPGRGGGSIAHGTCGPAVERGGFPWWQSRAGGAGTSARRFGEAAEKGGHAGLVGLDQGEHAEDGVDGAEPPVASREAFSGRGPTSARS